MKLSFNYWYLLRLAPDKADENRDKIFDML